MQGWSRLQDVMSLSLKIEQVMAGPDLAPVRDLSTPLLTRTAASWPTCLYALRIGTLSRLISISSTTVCSPGVFFSFRRKTAGFQSGASSAQNLASYHFSRPWNWIRSCKQTQCLHFGHFAPGLAASRSNQSCSYFFVLSCNSLGCNMPSCTYKVHDTLSLTQIQ